MAIKMELSSIVSATDLVKNFSKIRQKAKKGDNIMIFKNNKPDLAILDIAVYEELLKIAEQFENLQIQQIINERYADDKGDRYTTDEILIMRQNIINSKSSQLSKA